MEDWSDLSEREVEQRYLALVEEANETASYLDDPGDEGTWAEHVAAIENSGLLERIERESSTTVPSEAPK